MKKKISYGSIESAIYEFSEYDIKKALMEHFKVPLTGVTKMAFRMWGADQNKLGGAKIVLDYIEIVGEKDEM